MRHLDNRLTRFPNQTAICIYAEGTIHRERAVVAASRIGI